MRGNSGWISVTNWKALQRIRISFTTEDNSSVIRQKSESQNGYYKKTKHTKFSEKWTFLPPDTHTCILDNHISRFEEYVLSKYKYIRAYSRPLLGTTIGRNVVPRILKKIF